MKTAGWMLRIVALLAVTLLPGELPAGGGHAGRPPQQTRLEERPLALSLRIAVSKGKEKQAARYRSLFRQQRILSPSPASSHSAQRRGARERHR